jgi:hypothetical protein
MVQDLLPPRNDLSTNSDSSDCGRSSRSLARDERLAELKYLPDPELGAKGSRPPLASFGEVTHYQRMQGLGTRPYRPMTRKYSSNEIVCSVPVSTCPP